MAKNKIDIFKSLPNLEPEIGDIFVRKIRGVSDHRNFFIITSRNEIIEKDYYDINFFLPEVEEKFHIDYIKNFFIKIEIQ